MSRGYGQECVIARALDIVGDRWTLLVVRELMLGKQRFTDILDGCGKVSPNLLSDRLKKLEQHGLVERAYFKELPPRVEYRLTEAGNDLRNLLQAIIDWGVKHVGDNRLGPECLDLQSWLSYASAFYFDPTAAAGVSVTYVIKVGEDCGYLRVDNGACDVGDGVPEHFDVVFEGETHCWFDAVFNRYDFDEAVHSGRVRVSGSAEAARLFPTLLCRRTAVALVPATV
ncbi:MAG: hypothetical protein GEU28_12495 [Dehalococcoidia bacterium]|nr:hypothetical protein [Dehalococcoidia bacterium]